MSPHARRRPPAHSLCRLALAALVAALVAGPAAAANRFGVGEPTRTRETSAEVAAGGRAVAVENSSGNVSVTAGDGERVSIDARVEYWSDDQEWMAQVEREFALEVREEAGRIVVRPRIPEPPKRRLGRLRLSYAVDLSLRVPRGTAVDVRSSYGDVVVHDVGGPLAVTVASGNVSARGAAGGVTLDGRYGNVTATRIEGPLEVQATSGDVTLEQVSGDVRVAASYGSVRAQRLGGELHLSAGSGGVVVADVAGAVEIDAKYGDVDVRDVRGVLAVAAASGAVKVRDVPRSVSVRSSYGDVDVQGVGGTVEVAGSSGNVTVRDVEGALVVETSYGDVLVEDARGDVEAASASGGVTLARIAGGAQVRSSYGAVRAQRVGGALRVSGSSTEVRGEEIGGPVEVDTSYGGVELRGVRDAITVRTQSGAVRVSGFAGRALAARHKLATSYGDATVFWPRAAPLAAELESVDGSVASDLPGSRRELGSRNLLSIAGAPDAASLTVTARGGSVELRLE
jgi:DUF4097 and DUF4098 domain-containing protein YvlB